METNFASTSTTPETYNFLWFKGLTKSGRNGLKGITIFLSVAFIFGLLYIFNPGLVVGESKSLKSLIMSSEDINNVQSGKQLPTPSSTVSSNFDESKLIRIAEYGWNGNSGMIVANGGPRTTSGSLMENAGLSLEIVRQDMVSGLRDMQLKFVEEFDKGKAYPSSDKSAFGVSIMGDGAPFYVTTLQASLDKKFGPDKYHAKVIAAYGLSYGEDKVIGPIKWKLNPKSMKGAVISTVIGDGDWVLAVNFAFANGLKVNPDPTTYDADAVNFVAAENDDYVNAAKELIKSQVNGYTVPLKEVKDGVVTGKTVNRPIDGCSTWAPADKLAFDGLKGKGYTDVTSTKDFVNQMATTLIVIDEWAKLHEKEVIALLKQTYVASNQIKQYDEWARAASKAVQQTYDPTNTTPEFWYTMFKGQKLNDGGTEYNLGGTRVYNFADAQQYYGLTDGKNRYKDVYDQVGKYLTELNPMDFMGSNPKGVVPYENAVNLYFLKSIDGSTIASGEVAKIDYSQTKTETMASGQWNITFATGSATITSTRDLETIKRLVSQAETTKLNIVGHTDNVGNPDSNRVLSRARAEAVRQYLVDNGIPSDRFQLVEGRGDSEPVASNDTKVGQAKNRRVDVTLLK